MSKIRKEHSLPRKILDALYEWESIRFSRKPHSMMLIIILFVNILVVLFAAWIISLVTTSGENKDFFTAVYNTFTMILDAGCIQSVIKDLAATNVLLVIFCLLVILICMITFTGALIGYATSVVSSFIENANANSIRLRISGHIAVLGWNNRASEIINDLLYCRSWQKVVVLSDGDREKILQEIQERLQDTIKRENAEVKKAARELKLFKRIVYLHKYKLKNNVAVVVREGDVFSSVHLNNIQLDKAKAIIILGKDVRSAIREGASVEEEAEKSDSRTIKTLIQVVDIAGKVTSAANQKVVVEVENDWTGELVDKIVEAKLSLDECRVVPFKVHTVMGQLLSQFSLMPELNQVYSELFSNKGNAFYLRRVDRRPDDPMKFSEEYLNTHRRALPLLFIKDEQDRKDYFFYMAEKEKDIDAASDRARGTCSLKLNPDYWLPDKHVLILGTNSKISNVLDGYANFRQEWRDIAHVTIIDEEEQIRKLDELIKRQIEADKELDEDKKKRYERFIDSLIPVHITDEKQITDIIRTFVYNYSENSSILILSDDMVPDEEIDAKMMTYLIYAKDVINTARKAKRDVRFNVDIIAEVLDPRHVELIRSYDVDNVVISNRYISKMVTQIGEDFARYNLYQDIMNYDEMETDVYDGIEIYIKDAKDYFSELPPANTPVDTVIRSMYEASLRFWGKPNDFAMLLGYIDSRGKLTLFGGDREKQTVTLTDKDKLVVFTNH